MSILSSVVSGNFQVDQCWRSSFSVFGVRNNCNYGGLTSLGVPLTGPRKLLESASAVSLRSSYISVLVEGIVFRHKHLSHTQFFVNPTLTNVTWVIVSNRVDHESLCNHGLEGGKRSSQTPVKYRMRCDVWGAKFRSISMLEVCSWVLGISTRSRVWSTRKQ